MAKVTQVDFPPREIVSYTKQTQTPVVTQEKEGECDFTFERPALHVLWEEHVDAETKNNLTLYNMNVAGVVALSCSWTQE